MEIPTPFDMSTIWTSPLQKAAQLDSLTIGRGKISSKWEIRRCHNVVGETQVLSIASFPN